jgi:phage/plasmid-like protein (TIGR03299 family)
MPAGLTSTDSMFSVRETPWHGLGVVLDQPPATIAEAIDLSGLDWRVEKEPIAVDRGDAAASDFTIPRCEEIPGYYATVRQDTRQVLGIVGPRYTVLQNSSAFEFVDQLLGSSLHFETAGSLHGGRRVWVLATLPDHIEVGGDAVRPLVLLSNSHDGSTGIVAATTPVRVCCANTLYADVGIERIIRSAALSERRLDEASERRRFAAARS